MIDKADPAELAMTAVRVERATQVELYGQQDHTPAVWLAILLEEVGELATAVLRDEFPSYTYREAHSLSSKVTQVATVALAWLESLIRKEQEE